MVTPEHHDAQAHLHHLASTQHPGPHHGDQTIHCPECGAPVRLRGTTVSAVCEYCSSTVVRTGVDVELIGKVSALIDNGSPILLDSKGKYEGVPFVIDGRLQVQYERGTWNEWLLSFADGTVGWLADAQGQFAIVKPIELHARGPGLIGPATIAGQVPNYFQFDVGRPCRIAGLDLVVVDRRAAAYLGAEGLLPFRAEPGLLFYGVDLRGYRGEFMTLDWGDDPNHEEPIPYLGKAVSLAEINLFPLRRFEGWPPPRPPSA